MATRRFYSLEKRLATNVQLKQDYVQFMEQYKNDGHMTELELPESLNGWYTIPHHCVLRPDKSTTKCRVVFDASAKTKNNISLNDILKVGPVVQNDLVNVLLRFRLHKYGIMADITAMYRQILVSPEAGKVQTIVWRNNETERLKFFQLNTVTYGTACAPYLATRCLLKLATDVEPVSPEVAKPIKNDFYVDDLITGGSSIEQLQAIKHGITHFLEQGGFHLHKWYSNHEKFLSSLPEQDREKTIKINDVAVVKALGIIWDAANDCFKFNYLTTHHDDVITKRKVLSEMSKLFDPLGIIKPVIVKAKIFMQELWLKNLDWDEPISNDSAIAWKKFVDQLSSLNQLNIPRLALHTTLKIELHGFSDASTRAYGCAFYIRCTDAHENTKVTLLTARSKVAPIGTVRSLPCLELCAANLLTQYFIKLRSIANFDQFIFWVDSFIVLSWLKEPASSLNTFVANRVSFIQEHTNGLQWNYVPSGQNPADLVSRGATVEELQNSIWFSGPDFLNKSPDNWPKCPKTSSSQLPERKIIKTVLVTVQNDVLNYVHSKSNFVKICKVIAYCRRFIKNARSRSCRQQSQSILISANELDEAFINIVAIIQQINFASEISALNNNKQIHQRSSLKTLNPFLELEHNFLLLKVGGRLKKANLPYHTKCPVILPKTDVFIEGYITYLHQQNFHAGVQALMGKVQTRFWKIGLREYARKIIKRCILCFKYKPNMSSQIMGELPKDRITPVKPFTHTGVDFCGPIITTTRIRSKPNYKSYVAVFICFVTRAVHMEVVSNLTSEAFIAALKRFVARRGLCTTLYCDNATNFVGARNSLKELKAAFMSEHVQNEMTTWCMEQGITFKHIPPRSPHFGGLWEAAVKSAKSLLVKTMQSTLLTFEELNTVIIQIEGMLNSRPMTVMSNDPSDERALTPGHFLNVSKAECILEPKFSFNKISSLKHWQQISAIQQHFWNRWSKEVLSLMQQRQKWQNNVPDIKVNTLVMVHDDNLPPQKWIVGRVIKTFSGSDGKVRVAEIKTPAGIIKRAITKLAALPLENDIETP